MSEDGSWLGWASLDPASDRSKPAIVVIDSFNEYHEENAVAITKTDDLVGTSEKWPSPDAYWTITKTQCLARQAQ